MKKGIFGFLVAVLLSTCVVFVFVEAQTAENPKPMPNPKVFRTPRPSATPLGKSIMDTFDDEEKANDTEGNFYRPIAEIRRETKEKIKLTDEERDKYKTLAGDRKANVMRILSSYSCSTSLVIDLSDPRCLENPDMAIVGYYSFRMKDYGESPWTDISLIEDEFTAGNKWHTVGYMADLGETAEFGKLSSGAEEIRTLWELPTAETYREKSQQKAELEKGFTAGKLFFTSKIKLQINHTYLLRTIAYRIDGGAMTFRGGFNWYNTDTLFVFKVADFDSRRTATIVWKKIFQKVAPVLTEKDKDRSE